MSSRSALALAFLTLAAHAEWQVIETRKIWDAAPHSAFTDLTRHAVGLSEWLAVDGAAAAQGQPARPGERGFARELAADLQRDVAVLPCTAAPELPTLEHPPRIA